LTYFILVGKTKKIAR